MTVFTFPATVFPSKARWVPQANTQTFTSPLDRTTQTTSLPGMRWLANLEFTNLLAAEHGELSALMIRLRGSYGRFWLPNHSRPVPMGTAAGYPNVSGGGQTGAALATSGWVAYQTVLKAGDYIAVNGEFKAVVADANSDGSGMATLLIEPPLRASPPNGAVIVTDHPMCLMRLTSDDAFQSEGRGGFIFDASFSCVEAFS